MLMSVEILKAKGIEAIDRRSEALDGQVVNRNIEDIDTAGIHYTATLNSHIENHENYWSSFRKWSRGGYLIWIDREGRVYINYDYTRVTWGATGWNERTAHLSMESDNKYNYTEAQLKAMYAVLEMFLYDLPNLRPESILGHWEMTPTTACPGWNKKELDEIRENVKESLNTTIHTVKSGDTLME